MFDPNTIDGEPKLRDKIIATAIEIGTQSGASGLTMRALAKSLGVGATTLYQQFESKSAILQEIWYFGHHKMAAALEPAQDCASCRESLVTLGMLYVDFGRKQPWLYEVIMGRESPELSEMSDEQYFRGIEGYSAAAQIVERGIARGEVSPEIDPSTLILSNWAALHGITSIVLDGRFERNESRRIIRDQEGFIRIYIEAIVDALLTPKLSPDARDSLVFNYHAWFQR